MKSLFRELLGYKKRIVFILALTFGNVLSSLFLPNLMSQIVDVGIPNHDMGYILKTGGFMLLISIAGSICTVLVGYLASKTAAGVATTLRKRVFSKSSDFSLNEFDHFGTSSLITRTTNDITQIQQVIVMILRMMLMAPLMMIGAVVMAISKSPRMSMVLVVTAPVLLILVAFIIKMGMPLFKAIQKKIDKINLVAREKLSGVRVIRAFVADDYEKKRFDEASKDLTNSNIKVNRIMMTMMPALSLVLNFTIIAVLWLGVNQIDARIIGVGDLMAFIQYIQQILMSFMMLTAIVVMVPRAGVSMNRIQEVLDTEDSVKDPETPCETSTKGLPLTFENVSFRYKGADGNALENISFTATPGQTTAIIGSTGSGKSTLVKLIPRLYDTTEGEIYLGEHTIKEFPQENLRQKIGFVPQKAVLFTGTIESNIRYGKEDASEEEIKQAIEIAQASDFVWNDQKGLDREISQGGTNVSGGQKQRLSIARALVRRPEIYVFDDSFSALDYKTDASLRGALKPATEESIVIIVAQRVSTIMDADKILVLNEGKLVGDGTHRELLKTCDVYLEIAKSQLGEEVLANE